MSDQDQNVINRKVPKAIVLRLDGTNRKVMYELIERAYAFQQPGSRVEERNHAITQALGDLLVKAKEMERKLKDSEKEIVYARVFPHVTGKGQYSLEVRIPAEVRGKLNITKDTPLYVKVESGRLVYEKAPGEELKDKKR